MLQVRGPTQVVEMREWYPLPPDSAPPAWKAWPQFEYIRTDHQWPLATTRAAAWGADKTPVCERVQVQNMARTAQ